MMLHRLYWTTVAEQLRFWPCMPDLPWLHPTMVYSLGLKLRAIIFAETALTKLRAKPEFHVSKRFRLYTVTFEAS